MTFPMQRADTPWVGTLQGLELNTIDRNLSRALDGFAGGAYAPSTAITIGGSGLTVTGPFSVTGTFNFNGGTAFFNENLTVTEQLTCNGFVDFNAAVDISETLTVGGNVTINGLTTFNGTPTFNSGAIVATGSLSIATGNLNVTAGTATFGGLATFNGAADFNDPVTFDDTVTFNAGIAMGGGLVGGVLAATGSGHFRGRKISGADSNATYGINDADLIIVDTLTAARTYTLSTTGAAEGDRIQIKNRSTQALTVSPIIMSAGQGEAGEWAFHNSAWVFLWMLKTS